MEDKQKIEDLKEYLDTAQEYKKIFAIIDEEQIQTIQKIILLYNHVSKDVELFRELIREKDNIIKEMAKHINANTKFSGKQPQNADFTDGIIRYFEQKIK